MSPSRLVLVAFAALVTTFSVNPRTVAANSQIGSASAAPTFALLAAARPAPCCDGTLVGDD